MYYSKYEYIIGLDGKNVLATLVFLLTGTSMDPAVYTAANTFAVTLRMEPSH